ncbi:C39 family peptidase [Myxacorys almedinensis]|uniref:Peptidoglycan-binding protein n=1 Tax=Myxacorys almedinensis A TaxID=2690445 RepID=A0A8J8CMV4_9CYAN|nr:C39 family peptidase [Myxacorys almedinensis]NDJ18980.1 peptidoglycan-binding protein [Myxacorys almedinensis A]
MTLTLKILSATTLKQKPVQSSELADNQKQPITAGEEFELDSYSVEHDHVRCFFAKNTFKDTNAWYAFGKHIQVNHEQTLVFPKPLPDHIKLPIRYRSQRDNRLNPNGSCNVTSLAMCLDFLGAPRRKSQGQFEDELYEQMEWYGLRRHHPEDLARVVEMYGCRDVFRKDAKVDRLKSWLAEGNPAVIHGYFTSFGHIVVAAGYDATGFLIHDPYGEWHSWGYDRNEPGWYDNKGEYIHYSYNLISRLCIADGSFWVHFISKP